MFPLPVSVFPVQNILTYLFFTDGMGVSDFGESSRFQKVLQGQEIFGFNAPYDGVDTPDHHPFEIRCFPRSSASGIAAIGNGVRNPHGNSDISYKGIGFGESFRFHKVLQGQETFPSPPCGRALSVNQAHEKGRLGIYDGVQVPNSRNGWPAIVQGYSAHSHLPTPPVQVSSPSSVLTFQHESTATSNIYPMHCTSNQEEQDVSNRSSFDIPDVYGGKLTPSHCERNVRGGGLGGKNCFGLNEHNQLAVPHPLGTQTAFRGSQDLVPSCKSGCRLFGFSLTEEGSTGNKVDNPSPVTSSLIPGTSFLPQQLHSEPPVMTKAIGSNCTKVSNLCAVRDMLLDIAL